MNNEIGKLKLLYLIENFENQQYEKFDNVSEAMKYYCNCISEKEHILKTNIPVYLKDESVYAKNFYIKATYKNNNSKIVLYFTEKEGCVCFTNKRFKAQQLSRDLARKLVIYFEFIMSDFTRETKINIIDIENVDEVVLDYERYVIKLKNANENIDEEIKLLKLEKNELQVKLDQAKKLEKEYGNELQSRKKELHKIKEKYKNILCDKECEKCFLVDKIYEFYNCDFLKFREINCEKFKLNEKNHWFPYDKIENNFNYFQKYQEYYDKANFYFFREIISYALNENSDKKTFNVVIIGGGNGSELVKLNEVAIKYNININCIIVDKIIWPANYFHSEFSNIKKLIIKKIDFEEFINQKKSYDIVIFSRVINYKDLKISKFDDLSKEKYITEIIDKIRQLHSTYVYFITVIPKSLNYGLTLMVDNFLFNNKFIDMIEHHDDDFFIHKLYCLS